MGPPAVWNSRTGRSIVTCAALILCLGVALATWAFASPLGSAPDDGIHLGSIYCAPTASASLCKPGLARDPIIGPNPARERCIALTHDKAACRHIPALRIRYTTPTLHYFVPLSLVTGGYCYKLRRLNASCQHVHSASRRFAQTPSSVNKTGSGYPEGFYAVMGLLAGPNLVRSAYSMRILSVVLAAIFIVGALALAPPGIRQAGGIGIVVALGPLGWFTIASTNPSSWSVLGISVYWVFLLTAALARNSARAWIGAAGAGLAALVACSARADSGLFLLVLVVAVSMLVVPAGRTTRDLQPFAAAVAATTVISVFVLLTASQVSQAAAGSLEGGARGSGVAAYNVLDMPQIIVAAFGYIPYDIWQLAPPLTVPIAATMLVGMLFTIAFNRGIPRRTLAAWSIVASAIVLFPLVVLTAGHSYVGQTDPWNAQVEPRYLLPLLPALIGLPFLRTNVFDAIRFTRLQRWAWFGVCLFVFSVSLYVLIANFARATIPGAVSLSGPSWWWRDTLGRIDLNAGSRWQAIGFVAPMELWVIGTAAAGIGLLCAMRFVVPTSRSISVGRAPKSDDAGHLSGLRGAAAQLASRSPRRRPGHSEATHQ